MKLNKSKCIRKAKELMRSEDGIQTRLQSGEVIYYRPYLSELTKTMTKPAIFVYLSYVDGTKRTLEFNYGVPFWHELFKGN